MVELPLVYSFEWDVNLGKRLQGIRKIARNGQFSDRRNLAAYLKGQGIECSEAKLKRIETGTSPWVEKAFLRELLAILESGFEQLLDTRDQTIQLQKPQK